MRAGQEHRTDRAAPRGAGLPCRCPLASLLAPSAFGEEPFGLVLCVAESQSATVSDLHKAAVLQTVCTFSSYPVALQALSSLSSPGLMPWLPQGSLIIFPVSFLTHFV